jgi:hypothetical protein
LAAYRYVGFSRPESTSAQKKLWDWIRFAPMITPTDPYADYARSSSRTRDLVALPVTF